MPAYIQAIGTATPPHRLAQADIAAFMAEAEGMDAAARQQLAILYRASGIRYRYTVLPDYGRPAAERSFFPPSVHLTPFPQVRARMEAYEREATPLARRAVEATLPNGYDRQRVTHLITVSCTGMYAPGIDIELVEQLGLSPQVQRTAINFMGCYAAFVGIKAAQHICTAEPTAQVLVVCVELCTLHFQKGNTEEILLANALFGDGAAALLIGGHPRPGPNLALTRFYNDLAWAGKAEMAWRIGDFGFEMRLTNQVPAYIQAGIQQLSHNLLASLQLDLADIDYYAIHPGGKRILQVIETALGLSAEANRPAYAVMRDYGNMSSPTVLFVLHLLWQQFQAADQGKHVLSFAFGPGLTLESMLLQVVFG